MRPLFALLILCISRAYSAPNASLAQYSGKNPAYDVAVIADGKRVTPSQGIPRSAKTIRLSGKLTPESRRKYPQLKPDVTIRKAVISLVRDTKRVGFINWTGSESLAGLVGQIRTGDQFVIQFDDVFAQSKDGVSYKLADFKLMQLPVF